MTNINTFVPAVKAAANTKALPHWPKGSSVTVVGAGAFDGWTALYLLRLGYCVTLLDAWGPGHSRASSGDETRVIRSTYGANETYFDLNVRALALWKENEEHFQRKLFYNTGVLWFCHDAETPMVDNSIPYSEKHAQPYEYLSLEALERLYPIVHTHDLHHAYFDPYGGYLKAREACQLVTEQFVKEGGEYRQTHVTVDPIRHQHLEGIHLSDGTRLKTDLYVFACGSWLGKIFPDLLDNKITCTKQEVYYFGVPAEQAKAFDDFPVWVDVDGKDFYYGIAGNAHRGFKIGVDIRGEKFDPSGQDRVITPSVLKHARDFLAHRFPALKHAPLIESRVCPYENSTDGNFIVDMHPEADNVMIVGGGSGHGFKHGPALGELVAQTIQGATRPPDLFRL
jgi:glycine/D-amino acid oxidase-like deaminating enzyme